MLFDEFKEKVIKAVKKRRQKLGLSLSCCTDTIERSFKNNTFQDKKNWFLSAVDAAMDDTHYYEGEI